MKKNSYWYVTVICLFSHFFVSSSFHAMNVTDNSEEIVQDDDCDAEHVETSYWLDIFFNTAISVEETADQLVASIQNDFARKSQDTDETLLFWVTHVASVNEEEALDKAERCSDGEETQDSSTDEGSAYREVAVECFERFFEQPDEVWQSMVGLRDAAGNTLLHLAARLGERKLIGKLLPHINVNVINHNGKTPLMEAAGSPFVDSAVLSLLLELGANIDVALDHNEDTLGEPCNALLCALDRASKESIQVLLGKNPSFFYKNDNGVDKSVFNWVLESCFDSYEPVMPLLRAHFIQLPSDEQLAIMQLLPHEDKAELLYSAVLAFDVTFIDHILAKGFITADDIQARHCYSGYTMLHHAAQYGICSLVQFLLALYPKDINSMDASNRTPLICLLNAAAAEGRGECELVALLKTLELLLQAQNQTAIFLPLHRAIVSAIEKNSAEFVLVLLRYLESLPVENCQKILQYQDEDTPSLFWHALERGDKRVIDFLLGSQLMNFFDLNEKMPDGCTLLHLAAKARHENAVKYLLLNGDFSRLTKASQPSISCYSPLESLLQSKITNNFQEDFLCDRRVAQALLNAGFSPFFRLQTKNHTLMHEAALQNRGGIIDELIQAAKKSSEFFGVKSLVVAQNNNTEVKSPLTYAVGGGSVYSVEKLLETGAYDELLPCVSSYSVNVLKNEHYFCMRLFEDFFAVYPTVTGKSKAGNYVYDEAMQLLLERKKSGFLSNFSRASSLDAVKKELDECINSEKKYYFFSDAPYLIKAITIQSCLALELILEKDKKIKNDLNQSFNDKTALSLAILQLRNDLAAQDCVRRYGVCFGPARMVYLLLQAGASLEHEAVQKYFSKNPEIEVVVREHIWPLAQAKIEAKEQASREEEVRRQAVQELARKEEEEAIQRELAKKQQQEKKKKQQAEKKLAKKLAKQQQTIASLIPGAALLQSEPKDDSSVDTACLNNEEKSLVEKIGCQKNQNAAYAPQDMPIDFKGLSITVLPPSPVEPQGFKSVSTDLNTPTPSEEAPKLSPSKQSKKNSPFQASLKSPSPGISPLEMPINYNDAPKTGTSCHLCLTPRRVSKIHRHVGTDHVMKGPLINFADEDLSGHVDQLIGLDRVEESSRFIPGASKNKLTAGGLVPLHKRVVDRMACNIRDSFAPDKIDAAIVAHGLSTEFLVAILQQGSTYLQLSVPEPKGLKGEGVEQDESKYGLDFKLLIVATVHEDADGQLVGTVTPAEKFVTLAFSLDDDGRVQQAVHCCIQDKHPVHTAFTQDIPMYLLVDCGAKIRLLDSGALFLQIAEIKAAQAKKAYLKEMLSLLQQEEFDIFHQRYVIPEMA